MNEVIKTKLFNITVSQDGEVSISTKGDSELGVKTHEPNHIVLVAMPANSPQAASKRSHDFRGAARVGDIMPDGTVFIGISPHSGQPFFIPGTRSPKALSCTRTVEAIGALDMHGHQDWQLAHESEYRQIFSNGGIASIAKLVRPKFYWAVIDDTVLGIHPYPGRSPQTSAGVKSYIPVRYGFPSSGAKPK